MSSNFEIRLVSKPALRSTSPTLWLVEVDRVPVAQIERFPAQSGEAHPYKVFSCDSHGCRTQHRAMVVFYPEDGGWDAAVKHALTYAN